MSSSIHQANIGSFDEVSRNTVLYLSRRYTRQLPEWDIDFLKSIRTMQNNIPCIGSLLFFFSLLGYICVSVRQDRDPRVTANCSTFDQFEIGIDA